ncbi:ribonuclease HII [Candidatus Thorarchaeota archaeon]|jgi:ribonuclease HII|nr:MAG: ribonuclease HII [Candidatus Thorarchaeota archaeon]
MAESHRIAGIDEAGRGPMLGPMVVCGVAFDSEGLRQLDTLNVRDSKQVSSKRRTNLYDQILEIAAGIAIRNITAEDIDGKRERGISLNHIEALAFASILRELRPQIVYLDAADVDSHRFGETVCRLSGLGPEQCEVISEHRADENYPVVSAASIVAKVVRDRFIEELRVDFGDIGSGYPHDQKSIRFVKQCVKAKRIPPFVRRSWEPVRIIIEELSCKQLKLDEP